MLRARFREERALQRGGLKGETEPCRRLQLPIFRDGLTSITEDLAFERKDGKVVYFPGLLPVFQHDEKDLKSFRMPPLRQKSVPEVSREIGVAGDTLRKAIGAGRLHAFRKKR